ncbi:leucyl aminopeptidase [Pholiota conissans]|uniref:Aminopeptidase n=1 Tax=Pholiota conissans TaxID=109636 RepID=A0A9P5YZ61_9AGAR|nr:leucyl aminopeptidase [Pholiota conissans]
MGTTGSRSLSSDDPYRLPTNVKPIHYDLTLKTDLKTLTFQGRVKIKCVPSLWSTQAVFYQVNTRIGIVANTSKINRQTAVLESYDEVQQRITYSVKETLPTGSEAELSIAFHSTLGDKTRGYYRSFWEHDGKREYYALSQLSPTAARRVFPCWDEPALKATFAVTLISRKDTVNLSNMDVVSERSIHADETSDFMGFFDGTTAEESLTEWKITKFGTSPPMSTYGVAFANGRFEFLETSVVLPVSGRTIPLRTDTIILSLATPDLIHQSHYALDIKAAVLPRYEEVLDVGYPLPKLDTLIVLHDFEGAMENWGLIMGTASVYLLDSDRKDEKGERDLASIQSHEIAHMWFGNITTMEWWNYIYLNEGNMEFMGEVMIMDKIHPEWNINSEFVANHLDKAMAVDAKLSSHPVEIKCPDANDVNQIFDALSYSKAASILRMLCAYVGEDKFLQGISLYLKKHLYASIVTADLWEGISAATGSDIARIMEKWVTRVGYPVLSVTETSTGIHVRQDRFLETGIAGPEANQTVWNVPLGLLSTTDGLSSIKKTLILTEREASFEVDTTQPFKLNVDTTRFYRVLYASERLESIAVEAAKEDSLFSLSDKVGLLQDIFALAKAGLSSLSNCLTLVRLWKDEKEYLVRKAISNGLGEISSIWWENAEVREKFDLFRQALFTPLVDRLGYEEGREETADYRLLRMLAVEQVLDAGHERVIQELRKRFQYYMDTGDDSKIPVDLQRAIFIAAVRYGGRKEYDAMLEILGNPKTALEKNAAIRAVGSSRDVLLIQKTIIYVSEKARDHDMIRFILFLSMKLSCSARQMNSSLGCLHDVDQINQDNSTSKKHLNIMNLVLSNDAELPMNYMNICSPLYTFLFLSSASRINALPVPLSAACPLDPCPISQKGVHGQVPNFCNC